MLTSRGLYLIPRRFSARERKPPLLHFTPPPPPKWAQAIVEADKPTTDWQNPNTGEAPHMLYAVCRLKTTYGRPWWEKRIIREFGLDAGQQFVVVKNTPSVCDKLRIVQHLVKIMPVRFPNGLPKSADDFKYCQLKHNGDFVVRHRLDVTSSETQLSSVDDQEEGNKLLDRKYLKLFNKKRYLDHRYLEEHNKETHFYRLNQDGQEHRYKDLHDHWRKTKGIKDETVSSVVSRGAKKGDVRDIKNWFSSRNDDPVYQKVVAAVNENLPPPRF